MKTGTEIIAEERARQIKEEGYTAKSDDRYKDRQLALAAASYLSAHVERDEYSIETGMPQQPCWHWPWPRKAWKPSNDPIRNLAKAGALIAAEIDRLQRVATAKG